MGTAVGKNDSESGLIFEIDASNPRSYSGSGTSIYDLSGNNLTGTLTNGPTYSSVNGGVIVFDGTNDLISFSSTLLDNLTEGTISAWIKLTSTSGSAITARQRDGVNTYAVFSIGSYSSSGGSAASGTAGKLYWHGKNGVTQAASTNNISANIWNHVVVTFSATQASFYINGVFDSTTSGDYSAGNSSGVLSPNYTQVGCWNNNGGTSLPLSGNIANLSVYNRALGSSEVAQIFDATKGQFAPSLVTDSMILYLDAANPRSYGGSGTTWYDISGNNNHATLVNGVTYSTTNGGIFNLDGTDDYIDCPTTQTLYNANITIITGTRYNTTGNNGRILTSLGNNWLMGHWSGGAPRYYAEGWVSGAYDGSQAFGQAWHIYTNVQNYSSDTWSMYYENTLHASNSNGSQGPVRLQFCNGNYAGERSNCYVSFLLVYSKLLSTTEIAQNVDYFRGRFNI